ncbi:maltase 2-like [Phymastichus coffea]|uniref:maltase 2-like n=1 Tax=Phymastichus coffea TaxID=108790 RepID=UPI00273AB508|nr:maltase 2-like [Phymastichus coffea]
MCSFYWCIGVLFFAGFATGEIKNKGWWKNTVFYQVYPRSFMDSNDDGTGDLKGITSKLQHFKDSGIGAVWLSPIYASPMIDNGYDISDFRQVDSMFGTMADLEELVKQAKKLGIKIILDLVPNHTSDQHKWFQDENTKYDYYIWNKGKDNQKPPNNWLSVFGNSAWTLHSKIDLWYFHQFYEQQPDLNYNNPNVQKEMEDVIKFWLDKGIDGFRIDAVPHIYERNDLLDEPESKIPGVKENEYDYLLHIYTKDDPRTYTLIRKWRQLLDDYADKNNLDEKVILTEAYTNLENTTQYYNFGSHVPFNFNFIMNVNNKSHPADFKKVIDDWISHTPENETANWVMGNHDRSRTATRYAGRADQMTMLAMILPGIAVTYNGEEIAMEDNPELICEEKAKEEADPQANKCDFRDPARTPFQWDDTKNAGFSKSNTTWLPVHKNYKSLNLANQKIALNSHYKLYQKLTQLRSTSDALKKGKLQTEVLNDGKVLVVIRDYNDKKEIVILLINFSDDQPQSVDIKKYTSMEHHDTNIYVSSIGSEIGWNSTVTGLKLTLPGKASVVVQTVVGNTGGNNNGTETGKGTGTKTTSNAAKTVIVTSLLMFIKLR